MYELFISVANAAMTMSSFLSTQLLQVFNATGCDKKTCPSDTVNISSVSRYNETHGPEKFTWYTVMIGMLS